MNIQTKLSFAELLLNNNDNRIFELFGRQPKQYLQPVNNFLNIFGENIKSFDVDINYLHKIEIFISKLADFSICTKGFIKRLNALGKSNINAITIQSNWYDKNSLFIICQNGTEFQSADISTLLEFNIDIVKELRSNKYHKLIDLFLTNL